MDCSKQFTIEVLPEGLHFNDLIWNAMSFVPTTAPATSAGSAANNAWHVEATATTGFNGTALASVSGTPLVYSGPLVNCNLQVTLNASLGGGFNNGVIEVYQDAVPVLSVNMADTFLYPAPGVYNFPFVIAAGVLTSITLIGVAQCIGVDPFQELDYDAVLTPA